MPPWMWGRYLSTYKQGCILALRCLYKNMPSNKSITSEALPAVQLLNQFVTQPEIAAQLNDLANQALEDLKGQETYSVINFPVEDFKIEPPSLLGSVRIAAFHPNCEMDQEQHPNSTQFLYSLGGHGETRVLRNQWESDTYGIFETGALAERWHVVPPKTWHQSIGRGDAPWVMAALHTARKVEDEFRPAL